MEGAEPQKFPYLELAGVLALSAFVTAGIFLVWSRIELSTLKAVHQKENDTVRDEIRMLKEHLNLPGGEEKKS